MLRLVARLLEVEVMSDDVLLVWREEANLHVKLSPSLFLNPKRRVLECYTPKTPRVSSVPSQLPTSFSSVTPSRKRHFPNRKTEEVSGLD